MENGLYKFVDTRYFMKYPVARSTRAPENANVIINSFCEKGGTVRQMNMTRWKRMNMNRNQNKFHATLHWYKNIFLHENNVTRYLFNACKRLELKLRMWTRLIIWNLGPRQSSEKKIVDTSVVGNKS